MPYLNGFELNIINALNKPENIAITEHARIRLHERNNGAKAEKGYTTSVTDLGNCLLIVRNVPCYKCTECNEIIYTGDVCY